MAMFDKIKKLIPTKRKLMQLYFALLFNANLKGFVTGNIYQGKTKQFCAPGINCYSCPGAVGACPLGSLQGSFSAHRSTLYYVAGILLLYCILFGRMICGWLCPFGLIQELCYKVKTPKVRKSPVTRILSYLKYVILVFFVVIIPILYALRDMPLPAFCKYICPAGTLEGGISLLSNKVNASYFSMLGFLFTWKFLLMVSVLVGSVFIFRLFCRFLCPLGALYGLFNKLSFFGIKVERSKCTNCGLCVNHCKLDIHHVGDQECISCGECADVCPTQAIQWKGPKILLHPNEGAEASKKVAKRKTIVRCISALLLLGILAGAIGYYWAQPDISNNVPGGIASPDRGNQVGNLCYGTQLPIVNAKGTSDVKIDPTATGKVTVINFWGTWCTPCVAELPYFNQIAENYADSVTVIAVHSNLLADATEAAYIRDHYPDSKIIFSRDSGENNQSDYYTALGGRGTWPYTVVLDDQGVITNIFVSSLTYADLEKAVQNAMG